jgi:hypothetical protein
VAENSLHTHGISPRGVEALRMMETAILGEESAAIDQAPLTLHQPDALKRGPGGKLGGLNPQECFNRALETVLAALKSVQETRKYTTAELQRI